MRSSHRPLLLAGILALGLSAAPADGQIDLGPGVKTSPKLHMSLGAGGLGHAPGGAASAPGGDATQGPALEQLRQRLAEKLGARTTASDGSRFVLQVSNQGETGATTISAARAGHGAATARRAAHAAARHPDVPWAYDGPGGPEAWARLKPDYATCATGHRQSPIDIRGGIQVDLAPVQFDYHPSAFTVIDTGHTIQVDVAPGNFITVMGRRYELQQFHFHRPSEERVDGRRFDMVVHLVHRSADGHLAVVAVLLQRGGDAQPVVQAVWNNLPLEKGDALPAPGTLDIARLLPQDRRYYVYMGSLTTPPCTEGVLWMVMKQPVGLTAQQEDIFARLYPMNARPVQQADGRLIKESQ